MIRKTGARQDSQPRGVGSIEVIVAFTLLTTVLSVALPLVVSHNKILKDQRDYRLALDELSNQLDRFIAISEAIPEDELAAALEQLKISDQIADKLPNATLVGQLDPEDVGSRLTLRLAWGGPRRKAKPLTLVGWVFPAPREDHIATQLEVNR